MLDGCSLVYHQFGKVRFGVLGLRLIFSYVAVDSFTLENGGVLPTLQQLKGVYSV